MTDELVPRQPTDITPTMPRRWRDVVTNPDQAPMPDDIPYESPVCDREGCDGFGEPLLRCQNPDHWAEVAGPYYFHLQRAESPDGSPGFHGRKRPGPPRTTFCSDECSVWYSDHVDYVDAEGNVFRKRKVWVRVQDTIAMDGEPDRALPDYREYEHAENGVRVLVGTEVIQPLGKRPDAEEMAVRVLLQPIKSEPTVPTSAFGEAEEALIERRAIVHGEAQVEDPRRVAFFEFLQRLPESVHRRIGRMRFLLDGKPRAALTYAWGVRHEYPKVYAAYLHAYVSPQAAQDWLAREAAEQADREAYAAQGAALAEMFAPIDPTVDGDWFTDNTTEEHRP